MLTLAQWLMALTLAPLIGGVVLLALGSRARAAIGLGVAIVALAVAGLAAVVVAASVLPEGPLLVTMVTARTVGLVYRLDGFAALLSLVLTLWAAPVLVWMTTPRGLLADGRRPSVAPQGLALIALSLTLGAVLNDNVLAIALCWAGVALTAWLMSRPEPLHAPERAEWLDLTLLSAGPVLFALAMIPLLRAGQSLSLYDLAGHALANFGTGLLVVLALAFAVGVYPFTLWVRRVCQGIMTDAVGVLLLFMLPLGVALGGRLIALVVNGENAWPSWHVGPATIPLNIALLVLGVATALVSALALLFEHDLPVIAALLATLTLGWCFAAIGTGDAHALLGLVFLLLAYELGVGALLAVSASLEWADRELTAASLAGLARALPLHVAALALGGLTLVGVPLLAAFAGMVPVAQEILNLGGAGALAGGLLFAANMVALFGFLRTFSRAYVAPAAEWQPTNGTRREGLALLVPCALLLVAGVAPELLVIGKLPGPAAQAGAALLANGITLPDISTSPLGFGNDGALWLPGLVWALAVAGGLIVILSAALIGVPPAPSPVFVGGEPLEDGGRDPIDAWDDIARLARSPLVLPGPRAWRDDLGDLEGWPDDAPPDDAARAADAGPESLDDQDAAEYPFAADDDDVIDADANDAPVIDTDVDDTNVIDADVDDTNVIDTDAEDAPAIDTDAPPDGTDAPPAEADTPVSASAMPDDTELPGTAVPERADSPAASPRAPVPPRASTPPLRAGAKKNKRSGRSRL